MSIDVNVPQIGESVVTVFISRWLKSPGDAVKAGEGIVEIDSDKASMEVPAPEDGVLEEQLAEEGDEVDVGAVIARMGASNGAGAAPAEPEEPEEAEDTDEAAMPQGDQQVRAGPAVRQAARDKGIDLKGVEGSGKRGRVTRKDVEQAARPAEVKKAPEAKKPPEANKAPAAAPTGTTERVPMSPLRRTIARRLVEAQQTAAILTTFNEVDMSAVMALRKRYQERFVGKYGIKLGFMSFFVKASISALMEFPAVNAEIDGDAIVYKRFWNIGVAVSGPKGLVVPVVKGADQLSFAQTEQAIADLATKARDNKLALSDFQDGTFTISNGGIFGSMMSTPILNPPQVAILGMHNIVKRAVVVDDTVQIRPMMYLALSYDHRIIDGREAVRFLVRIKELVEDPERILIEV